MVLSRPVVIPWTQLESANAFPAFDMSATARSMSLPQSDIIKFKAASNLIVAALASLV
jgi:hypothetical protein